MVTLNKSTLVVCKHALIDYQGMSAASLVFVLLIGLTHSQLSYAEALNYNLYSLSADAEKAVDNDLMQVTLSAEHRASKAKEATNTVNSNMSWALAQSRKNSAIDVKTTGYNTRPVYKDKKIIAWEASQTLVLESKSFETLSTLVSSLQDRLQVSAMQFKVSKAARNLAEDELTQTALKRFTQRAELVKNAMGASGFDMVSVSVNAQGGSRPMMHRKARSMMMDAAIEVEGGSSTLRVNVSGQVQLNP